MPIVPRALYSAFNLALLLGAVLCSAVSPAGGQTNATVRVATLPIDAGAEAFYAKEMGFFTKAGLDVDVQPMQNSSALAAAVVSGAIDVGFVNLVSMAAAHQRNVNLVAIAPGGVYSSKSPPTALMVPPASPLRNAKDLNGKTVGTQGLGTINEYATQAWIDRNGGDASTVKFVEVAFSEMTPALSSGRVDAAILTEPYLTVARKSMRVLGYPFDAIAKEFIVNAWVTTPQWAKDHPDAVKRFAAAIRETAIWANNNQPKSGEILAKYTKIDPAVIPTMARVHYAEQFSSAPMQIELDVSAKYGRFSTFPAQELLYKPPN
jgi:NitT/TauT family transport system substrate-binding protein